MARDYIHEARLDIENILSRISEGLPEDEREELRNLPSATGIIRNSHNPLYSGFGYWLSLAKAEIMKEGEE